MTFKDYFIYGPLFVWFIMLFIFVRPLKLKWKASLILSGLLLLAFPKFLFYEFFGGDYFIPELPAKLIQITGWAYSSCLLLFSFCCVLFFWRLFYKLLCRLNFVKSYISNHNFLSRLLSIVTYRKLLITAAIFAMILAFIGIWEGVRVPDVKTYDLTLKGLPASFDNLCLVQISDLHCSSSARRTRTENIVKRVNSCNPDLVCITGDFIDGKPALRKVDLEPLKNLKASLGVFGVSGNHEYYHDYSQWRPIFTEFGVQMLDNEHRVLKRGNDQLVIGGVTDEISYNYGNHEISDVCQAFTNAPANTCRILLDHRPTNTQLNAENGVVLQLSGHTHGGMAYIIKDLVRFMGNEGHVSGFYYEHGLTLYVSPGSGQWPGFPLRLGANSEITRFILHSEKSHP